MSADLVSDPAIFATYHELRNPDSALNWLFLGYSAVGSKDRLELANSGDSGLEGLKSILSQSNALNIHFGLLRLEGRFLLFTLLPDNTGGVKRARALVHSRAVGTKLQHQGTLTIARPSDLTLNAVRSKLKLDTGSASSSLPSSPNPQLSAGTSSPYLQPSPLRSHFPTNAYSSNDNGPPPPPDKDAQTIIKMRSNNSLHTPQLATPPFQLPIRQSSREGHDPTSPQYAHYSPPVDGSHTPRNRQVSGTSAGGGNSPASIGLGLGGSMSSSYGQPNGGATVQQSSSGYSNISTSPRLASSLAFERDQRNTAAHNGPASPTMVNTSAANARLTPRSASPAGSVSSLTSASNVQRSQDLPPLPLSASPSVPTSNRSLEASTLDSMFRPSESVESLHDQVATKTQRSPQSSPQQVERIAVAEAIARAAEAKWQAEQKRASIDSSNGAISGNTPVVRQNGFHTNHADGVDHHPVSAESAMQLSENGADLENGEGHAQEKESLRLQAESELARLEEEGRQRARAQQQAEQERRQAEQKQLEADAANERRRLEAEAEAQRVRLAAEAEALRERQEAEVKAESEREAAAAEMERQRKEAEAELERQRQEAEAAAEAERIRIEEAKIAEEKARVEAIETAKRQKEEARERARQDLRDRIASSPGDVALTGFLSVQGGSSILWRRRYFQMTSQALKLYKNDRELASAMDQVALSKSVKKIEENAEDLMAIPHSFKLIFNDYDEEPYLFYCDEEDDKDLLLVGLKAAARLE